MQAPLAPRPASKTDHITLCGPEDPDRVLTIRFDSLMDGLLALPEPSGDDLARLRSGADLLLGLMNGAEDFGAATQVTQATQATDATQATGATDAPDFASVVLGLTDEAFDQARRILDEGDPYYRQLEEDPLKARAAQALRMLDHLYDSEAFESVRGTLLAAESAEDPSAARDLL